MVTKETMSKGGKNRMANTTKEERKELGKKGALEKLHPTFPKATHSGTIQIGDKKIDCAVLKMPDGNIKRVLSAKSVSKVMGREGGVNSFKRREAKESGYPIFLSAKNIRDCFPIGEKEGVTLPIIFKNKFGKQTIGYDYRILTMTCEAYLRAKDDGKLQPNQFDLAKSCEMLIRAFAGVGLVSIIDEASGFQEVRDRFALQQLLDKYLRKEFAEWAKRFPNSFYKEIFRLNKWKFAEIANKRPSIIGKYTNDIVYSRLLPELVDELERINPKGENGFRQARHHQWLNDTGNQDLNAHIRGVTAIMRATSNWKEFKQLLERIYPVKSAKDVFLDANSTNIPAQQLLS